MKGHELFITHGKQIGREGEKTVRGEATRRGNQE